MTYCYIGFRSRHDDGVHGRVHGRRTKDAIGRNVRPPFLRQEQGHRRREQLHQRERRHLADKGRQQLHPPTASTVCENNVFVKFEFIFLVFKNVCFELTIRIRDILE